MLQRLLIAALVLCCVATAARPRPHSASWMQWASDVTKTVSDATERTLRLLGAEDAVARSPLLDEMVAVRIGAPGIAQQLANRRRGNIAAPPDAPDSAHHDPLHRAILTGAARHRKVERATEALKEAGEGTASAPPPGTRRTVQHHVGTMCIDGIQTYGTNTTFLCPANSTDSSSGSASASDDGAAVGYSAAAFAALPAEARVNCTPASNATMYCACARDAWRAVQKSDGQQICYWGGANCTAERVAPAPCPPIASDVPAQVDGCLAVPRSSTLTLSARFRCQLLPLSVTRFVSTAPLTVLPEDLSVLLFNATDGALRTTEIADVRSDTALFNYLEPPGSAIPITAEHPIATSWHTARVVPNFRYLSDDSLLELRRLGANYTAGTLTGEVPLNTTLDLSAVPAGFVVGGRLFVEFGLQTTGSMDDGEAVMSVAATVGFTDLPLPPWRTSDKAGRTALIIGVTVAAVVIVVGLGVLGVYIRQRSYSVKEKED